MPTPLLPLIGERQSNAVLYVVIGCMTLMYLTAQYREAKRREVKVPAIGPSGRIASYFGAILFFFNARKMIQKGYGKYKGGAFKVPKLQRWHVIISGDKLVEEVRRAPEDLLSFKEAVIESLAIPWTIGSQAAKGNYQTSLLHTQLTRSLNSVFDDIRDEIHCAFGEVLKHTGDEWTAVPAYEIILDIVSRTSNRVFVGFPLCREAEYVKLSAKFAIDVMTGAAMLSMVPSFMRPVAGKLLSCARTRRRAEKFFKPIIEDRFEKFALFGSDYPDKPVDMLTWLIEKAEGDDRTVEALTTRIMSINVAAIHTSTMVFTHALYHLAAEPEKYVPELREEVKRIIQERGWSKESISTMRKIDSFLKETLRYDGVDLLSLTRKAIQPHTLSDGTFLPAGTFVSAACEAIHLDNAKCSSANTFDGFRYVKSEDIDAFDDVVADQMAVTDVDYLVFGHGRHACPGRFFAAIELKVMLAHLVLHYDVRTVQPGVRPTNRYIGTAVVPDPTANVLIKRRSI